MRPGQRVQELCLFFKLLGMLVFCDKAVVVGILYSSTSVIARVLYCFYRHTLFWQQSSLIYLLTIPIRLQLHCYYYIVICIAVDGYPPPGTFILPHGLALAEDKGLLCVADRENGRIQCFDLQGNFIRQIHPPQFGRALYALEYCPNHGRKHVDTKMTSV